MGTGVLVVTTLYVLANVAYLVVLPADSIAHAPQDRVATAALEAMFGSGGLYIMAIAIMISTFGCNNGLILSGRASTTPWRATTLFLQIRRQSPSDVQDAGACTHRTGDLDLRLVPVGHVRPAAQLVIFAAVVFYAVTAIGIFRLRRKRPDLPRPVKAPGYPVLPPLYVLLTGLIAVDLLSRIRRGPMRFWGWILVLLGVPVYYAWRRLAVR